MQCSNEMCKEEIRANLEFCPFCGVKQDKKAPEPVVSYADSRQATTTVTTQNSLTQTPYASTTESLVMRASKEIWHFTESEGIPKPGQRRPLLILDEETVHLAHTDQMLTAPVLLNRVRDLIQIYDVPVEAQLVNARWFKDDKETRPRIMAFLQNHPFSDMKMIFGVDYLGKWASVQMSLCHEPEPIPPSPQRPEVPPNPIPIFMMVGGGMLFLIGILVAWQLSIIGILSLIAGFIWKVNAGNESNQKYQEVLAQWEAEKRRRENQKDEERLSRTYKVDDMRLFASSMRVIFKVVVDDIVRRGGEVVRVEGGQGGYFNTDEAGHPAPTPRRADAATSGV